MIKHSPQNLASEEEKPSFLSDSRTMHFGSGHICLSFVEEGMRVGVEIK